MQNSLLVFSSNLSQELLYNYLPTEIELIPTSNKWSIRDEWLAEIQIEIPSALLSSSDELIPSFSSLVPDDYAYQFSLEVKISDVPQTTEYHLSSIGKFEQSLGDLLPTSSSGEAIGVEVDLFTLKTKVRSAFLKLRVVSSNIKELLNSPYLLSIQGVRREYDLELEVNSNFEPSDIEIPAISQMVQDQDIRRLICSPTSVTMVLQSFGLKSQLADVLKQTYNLENHMYGIWPANIWAASRWGILGYIASFSDWSSVVSMLRKKIPIVAAIGYEAGELTNAAVEQTAGHLVVVRGFEGEWVLVNDPAAPSHETVKRKYKLDEFVKVWIKKRGGIGYVLFPGRQVCYGKHITFAPSP